MSSPEPTRPDWAVVTPSATGSWGPPELETFGAPFAHEAAAPDPVAEARAAGYREGLAAGRVQARAELAPAETALAQLIGEIEREMVTVRARAEANLYAVGLAVARWLMLREVTADPTVVESLIRRAVALLPAGTPVEIHAPAGQVELLTNALSLTEPDGRPLPVHWVADPELEAGSFRLVSPERLIDGRADVALRGLYERLAGD